MLYLFSILRNLGSNRGFLFTQFNRANTQNLENINFDMFYKNDCWTVICYPICVTNISYEREIIVLSFPDISFVIPIFIFQRFDIKSGFPFYWLTLYISFGLHLCLYNNSIFMHCEILFLSHVINSIQNWTLKTD